jgi:antitoxin ParD1/3/4
MHVSLTPQLEEIVRNKVASGMYNNASEVIREALRLLDEHERARFEALKAAVAIGYAQAERGQYAAWTPELHAQIRQRADDLAKQDQRPKADVLP